MKYEPYWLKDSFPRVKTHKTVQIWHWLQEFVAHRTQLSIEHRIDSIGQDWWHVEDPRTGKTFNAESLNVALHWIEENRLGR